MCIKVQVHQSWTFSLTAAWQCFIWKAITHPSGVRSRSMSTWWKTCLISFQIDLVPSQYHVSKASKSSWQVASIYAESYVVVVGLIFTLRTLAQDGPRPNEMKNTSEMPKYVLLPGHHIRRQARATKLSWRPNPCEVRVNLGLQEHFVVKQTPRSQTDSVFNDPHMDGKLFW